jgi:5,10-methylenetetrahydrofolate reductase
MASLAAKIAAGQRVFTAELPAVDGGGVAEVERLLAPMRDWVDAVNATDNTAAHAHASPMAISIAMLGAGVEPIMQLVCRDRNRLALESEIVGAAMHGIENICCLTGDDVTAGDEPEARRVFDLDGPQLVSLCGSLARGRYLSGRALIPSISILRTARSLRFVDERVPGIRVPADVIARVERSDDEQSECFEIAYELASHALSLPGVRGLHFISFRKDAGIAKLCTRLGIPPRAEREEHGHRPVVAV